MLNRGRVLYWLGLIVVAGVVMAYVQHRDFRQRHDTLEMKQQQVKDLEVQLKQNQYRERMLQGRVERLDSDPIEMEKVIRRDKDRVRRGEHIYRVEIVPDQGRSG